MNRVFEFTKEDLLKVSYFALCKFKLDILHHQGTSAKRDLLGGFLDRWINRASEYVVLNNILKEKKYKVFPDFFLYSTDTEKNAPDVLGLMDEKGGIAVRFSKFYNGSWKQEKGMPFVEVKNWRKDQMLVGVREPQMEESNYYVFVETDIVEDYLKALFELRLFDENIFNSLNVNKGFIESDSDGQILNPIPIEPTSKIGTFRLLGIYSGQEVKKFSVKCLKEESPHYLKSVENSSPRGKIKISEIINCGKSTFQYKFKYRNKDNEEIEPKYLPLYLDFEDNVKIIKKNKGSVYLKSKSGNNKVLNLPVEYSNAKLNFSEFKRTSDWNEYVGYKCVFDPKTNGFLENKPEDKTEELINLFDKLFDSR